MTARAVDIVTVAGRILYGLLLAFGAASLVGLAAHLVFYALRFGWSLI